MLAVCFVGAGVSGLGPWIFPPWGESGLWGDGGGDMNREDLVLSLWGLTVCRGEEGVGLSGR